MSSGQVGGPGDRFLDGHMLDLVREGVARLGHGSSLVLGSGESADIIINVTGETITFPDARTASFFQAVLFWLPRLLEAFEGALPPAEGAVGPSLDALAARYDPNGVLGEL